MDVEPASVAACANVAAVLAVTVCALFKAAAPASASALAVSLKLYSVSASAALKPLTVAALATLIASVTCTDAAVAISALPAVRLAYVSFTRSKSLGPMLLYASGSAFRVATSTMCRLRTVLAVNSVDNALSSASVPTRAMAPTTFSNLSAMLSGPLTLEAASKMSGFAPIAATMAALLSTIEKTYLVAAP